MLSISFTRDSLKFIEGLETKAARRVYEKTTSLGTNPYPASSVQMTGKRRAYFRLRVGDIRVIYQVVRDAIQIVVIDNRADDEVYRHLERLLQD